MNQQGIDFNWPIVISLFLGIINLLLTSFLYYYVYWRRTKLKVFKPRQYKLDDYGLQIALTFFADGPTPIIIQDLQLLTSVGKSPLKFQYMLEHGKREQDEIISININSHEQKSLICVFTPMVDGHLVLEDAILELQSKFGASKKWERKLCQFSLNECNKIVSDTLEIVQSPFDF